MCKCKLFFCLLLVSFFKNFLSFQFFSIQKYWCLLFFGEIDDVGDNVNGDEPPNIGNALNGLLCLIFLSFLFPLLLLLLFLWVLSVDLIDAIVGGGGTHNWFGFGNENSGTFSSFTTDAL